jgi:hypothetical protein
MLNKAKTLACCASTWPQSRVTAYSWHETLIIQQYYKELFACRLKWKTEPAQIWNIDDFQRTSRGSVWSEFSACSWTQSGNFDGPTPLLGGMDTVPHWVRLAALNTPRYSAFGETIVLNAGESQKNTFYRLLVRRAFLLYHCHRSTTKQQNI